MKIKIRTRFFLAVEGESEQSFIKWLQQLSDKCGLHIHLDCQPLNGGGYKTMLRNALYAQQHHERYKAKASILLVDGDRAEHDDNWTIAKLAQEAAKEKFLLCLQNPNHEGLLLRMMPGKEYVQPPSASAYKELVKLWPSYQKNCDASMLASKFSFDDLFRAAQVDAELKKLLSIIGLLL